MVLVYMLTFGYIDGIHVTIYSSTMDPMGHEIIIIKIPYIIKGIYYEINHK